MGRFGLVACVAVLCAAPGIAAERVELREEVADARVRNVAVELNVEGKLFPEPGPDKAIKLAVEARFKYAERRLAGTAREAASLRAVRHYNLAKAVIEAGEQTSNSALRKSQRLIVAHGQLDGIELFSPSGPLTYGELELLRIPGDSLALVGLLPDAAVEVEETWKAPDWVLPLLTGIEAVEKGELKCRLESATAEEAQITVSGDVTGAVAGAAAVLRVEGRLVYDRGQKLISRVELTQTEKRAIGAVSPGLDVVAKVTLTRQIADRPSHLTDRDLADLPLEPNDANRLLMFDAPAWNVRFYYDRVWHLFHQTSEVALLRLLDKGGLIAQCNIKRLVDAEPGKHVSLEQFQADIQETLGKHFQEIVRTERLKLKDAQYVARVIVAGTVERKNAKQELELAPVQWIYYLVASRDGRQLSFVFSVDPAQAKDLDNRDLAIVTGLEFLTPRAAPTPAVKSAGKTDSGK
jgi:hypothetical protein